MVPVLRLLVVVGSFSGSERFVTAVSSFAGGGGGAACGLDVLGG